MSDSPRSPAEAAQCDATESLSGFALRCMLAHGHGERHAEYYASGGGVEWDTPPADDGASSPTPETTVRE